LFSFGEICFFFELFLFCSQIFALSPLFLLGIARLWGTINNPEANGTVLFVPVDFSTQYDIIIDVQGLPPGDHGIHIHQVLFSHPPSFVRNLSSVFFALPPSNTF
jgi:hypothetical protein